MTDHDASDDVTREDQWNGSRADALIARIVDRAADAADWDGFKGIARDAPRAWEGLLDALRLDSELRGGVEAELARAERVELPQGVGAGGATIRRLPRWSGWTGWAAAALVAVCWFGSDPREPVAAPGADPVAGHTAPGGMPEVDPSSGLAPDGAPPRDGPRPRFPDDPSTNVSLASDQFVSEQPMQVVETRPAVDGRGYDVLYVRRSLQRAHVGNVYSLGTDEQGRSAPVAIDPALLASADSL
jgi:hypothetical protein